MTRAENWQVFAMAEVAGGAEQKKGIGVIEDTVCLDFIL